MPNRSLLSSIVRLPYRLSRSIRKRVVYNRLKHYDAYPRGSVRWLQAAEKHFGGIVTNIPLNTSPMSKESRVGFNGGGDRMFHHNYAKHYVKHLARFSNGESLTIVECGILCGSGLAIWSALFPQTKIIGLDIDPSNFQENLNFLKKQGAFQNGEPKIIQFDQLAPNTDELQSYLRGGGIDIFIDDGMHTNESIINTLRTIYPLMNKQHVCFIEDNADVINEIKKTYSNSRISSYGELTVLENK